MVVSSGNPTSTEGLLRRASRSLTDCGCAEAPANYHAARGSRALSKKVIAWSAVGAVAIIIGGASLLLSAKPTSVPVEPPRGEADVPSKPILYSGCVAVRLSSGCELPEDGTLRVWLPSPDATVVSDAGQVEELERIAKGEGVLLRLKAPSAARSIRVPSAGRGWQIDIHPAPAPNQVLRRTNELRRAGKVAEAESVVAKAMGSAQGERRARLVGLRARMAADQGDLDRARSLFAEAIATHRDNGAISLAADDGFALAFHLIHHHRLSEAREVISSIEGLAASYPDGAARLRFYWGQLASESGDLRSALSFLQDAEQQSRKIGLVSVELMSAQALTPVLVVLGRGDEALERLETLRAASNLGDCQRADVAADIGWIALQALLQHPHGALEDRRKMAEVAFRQALQIYESSCVNDASIADARIVLAWTLLLKGDVSGAQRELELGEERVSRPPIADAVWWLEIRGRIQLAAGDVDGALAAFDRQLELARATSMLDAQWRAQVGRAEALDRKGATSDALAAARAADDQLDRLVLSAPLGQGRESFLSGRERSTRVLVDLLVRAGRAEEAFSKMRRGQARLIATVERAERLRSLPVETRQKWESAMGHVRVERESLEHEAEQDWKLSAATLREARRKRAARQERIETEIQGAFALLDGDAKRPAVDDAPLAPGVTRLGFLELERGWVVFAQQEVSVQTALLPSRDAPSDPTTLAARLVALAAGRIDASEHLVIHATGVLKTVDFHALAWNGAPLVASKTVAYALDVGPRTTTSTASPRRALLVADPTQDLLYARGEVDHVRAALGTAWEVRTLMGDEARSLAVLDRMRAAELFHYAGHGEAGGRDGWGSRLPLAAGSSLTLSDVLSLSSAPRHVVLSGCDAARVESSGPWMGLGLAQAFVVSGAADVIAPARGVDDVLARAMANAIYRDDASRWSAPDRLARAQRAMLRDQPALDWAAYRAVVR